MRGQQVGDAQRSAPGSGEAQSERGQASGTEQDRAWSAGAVKG